MANYTGTSGNDVFSGDATDELIQGLGGNDQLSGNDGNDVIVGGTGTDTLLGGNGNDTFQLANGDFASSEQIDGNADTDAIVLTNATTVNFSTGTVSGIEILGGSSGNDAVTLGSDQLLQFTSIDLAAGTNTLNILAKNNDLSAGTLPTISATGGTVAVNITGASTADNIKLSGAQLDALNPASINLGTGSDTLFLTSTSTVLNAISNTGLANVEAIAVNGAAAGVTIDLTLQIGRAHV